MINIKLVDNTDASNEESYTAPKRNIVFKKVSEDIFIESIKKNFPDNNYTDEELHAMYEDIKLPVRKTSKAAGYDFNLPMDLDVKEGDILLIPTGIRCKMDNDLVLNMYPRSSYGFKYGMRLLNTVGIIDADYYDSSNEGHIMIKVKFEDLSHNIYYGTKKNYHFNKGDSFVQGVFVQYFIADDDDVDTVRDGGIGSTDNK